MMEDRRELLRKIPKIDEVLQDERLFFFTESTPRAVIVESVREVTQELRKDILEGRMQQGWCFTPTWEGQIYRTRHARASWT